jgi:exodeoxyribonuclease V alpha subunit
MSETPIKPEEQDVEFSALDVHFAQLMTRLAGSDDPALALAASLASRATANGDVCVQLADDPVALRASPVVGKPGDFRPLILDSRGRLYLYRYWEYEQRLAANLLARASDAEDVDEALLRRGLDRHFPDPADAGQKLAAAMAVLRRLCVISGGPGTGKTTTVVKILALLAEQARGHKLAIGLAAPTGKAAARVQDAIRRALDALALDDAALASIPQEASTLHRLLGARPDSVYYRYNADNPLPLDVLVVDEASMADLALAAKLLEALPARTRLILLGDKDQLASVEAGAVLGDICAEPGVSARFAKRLAALTGIPQKTIPHAQTVGLLSDSIAILARSYRFGPDSGIGMLARLVNEGRGDDALDLMRTAAKDDIAWRTLSEGELEAALANAVVPRLRGWFDAIRSGSPAAEVFERFNAFRVLCAHRTGRMGINTVNRMIEEILESEGLIRKSQAWYAGRPVMIVRNDYNLRLFNGDVGIALPDADDEGRLKVFFPPAGGAAAGSRPTTRKFAPARLPDHETVYAMTIHKSQGSEFGDVLIVLPGELSAIMSRELVYTGITRAMKRVEIWGREEAFRDAVQRRLLRASALRERLWGGGG